jgi:tyrosine-specific transport protein
MLYQNVTITHPSRMNNKSSPSFMSGVLLISGTCIGAGMLALPVVTGASGFWPFMGINTLCWLFMLATGLLFLEATLWMHEGANVLSMAERFLGPIGKWAGGASFLFLYYCLMVSYISGVTPLLSWDVSYSTACAFAGVFFGLLILWGTKAVDRINWLLMIGAIISFVLLVILGSSQVNALLLARADWRFFLIAAPTLFSAYGYHNIIPTLTFYSDRNRSKMRKAILFGTLLPFIVYSVWEWLIIGSMPLETIQEASDAGVPITYALQHLTGHPWISTLGSFFGVFALVTSLLGVALSMVDFLGDGLKMKRAGWHRLVLTLLTFIPPTIFAAYNPGIFLIAIGVAGGYGEAILNGLLPAAMVWVGRYHMKLQGDHELVGGKGILALIIVLSLFIIGLESYYLLIGG